jgi:hypothetical protein
VPDRDLDGTMIHGHNVAILFPENINHLLVVQHTRRSYVKVNVPQLFSALQIRQRLHEQGAVSEYVNHFDIMNST